MHPELREARFSSGALRKPDDGVQLIVLTAPFTEMIDHAGYFIQMGMDVHSDWMEGVINRKPRVEKRERRGFGGLALGREFGRDVVALLSPIPTRIVAI